MESNQNSGKLEALVPKSGERERRHHSRFRCWGSTWINILPDGIKIVGYLLNLGSGGCQIETDVPLPAMANTTVEVLIRLDGYTLRLLGVIRHVDENARAGIEFIDVSPRKAEQIQHVMAAINEAEKMRLAGVEELGG
jgi:hypothetical protein